MEVSLDGTRFEGSYRKGKKQEGTLSLNDGGKYKGQFKKNLIEGKGTFKWGDGRAYTGSWKENLMHGYGKLTWPNNECYQG